MSSDGQNELRRLLSQARRRDTVRLLFEQSAFAFMLAMGGAILLLLTGTQVLEWYWLVVLFGGALGAGLWRGWKKLPSMYALAQRIDRRLELHDTLSTALHFSMPEARGNEEVRRRQREDAENTARGADLRIALPFAIPRSLYTAGGLALVVAGLFLVRYGVTGSLSLKPSLLEMAFDTFQTAFPNLARAAMPAKMKQQQQPEDPGDTKADILDKAPDSVLDTIDVPEVNYPDGPQPKSSATGPKSEQPAGEEGEQQEDTEKSGGGKNSGQEDQPAQDSGGKQGQNAKPQNAKQDAKGQENSSLMDKMRDAMANLLNKLKPKEADGQQSAQNSKDGQKSGEQQKSQQKGQQGSKSESSKAEGSEQGDPQDQGAEQNQNAQARPGEKAGEKSASQDAKSGMGQQEGNKDAREAEQLEAMGKISEIIGKRSQNITGEVMVEVSTSRQQIRTPWQQRNAAHSEAGGEINRDEVPLIYQHYVQQYFEEVRKSPAAAASKPATAPKPDAVKPATKK